MRALPLLRLDTLPLQKPQLLATALLLAVASPCALANAADTTRDSAPKELDKVVVTATKHAQAMRTAPASVSVVDLSLIPI